MYYRQLSADIKIKNDKIKTDNRTVLLDRPKGPKTQTTKTGINIILLTVDIKIKNMNIKTSFVSSKGSKSLAYKLVLIL